MIAFVVQMVTIGLGLAASIAVNVLDYFAVTSEGKRWWKRFLIWATSLLAVASLVSAVTISKDAAEEKRLVEGERTNAQAERDKAEEERRKAEARNRTLHAHVARLESKLDPFLALARTRHPGQPDEQALVQLHAEVEQIAQRTNVLEDRTSQRIVPRSQLAALITALSQHRGQRMVIEADEGDMEARVYRGEIAEVLKRAGWSVEKEGALGGLGPPVFTGLAIRYGGGTPPVLALELNRILTAHGMASQLMRVPSWGDGQVKVSVGRKPAL